MKIKIIVGITKDTFELVETEMMFVEEIKSKFEPELLNKKSVKSYTNCKNIQDAMPINFKKSTAKCSEVYLYEVGWGNDRIYEFNKDEMNRAKPGSFDSINAVFNGDLSDTFYLSSGYTLLQTEKALGLRDFFSDLPRVERFIVPKRIATNYADKLRRPGDFLFRSKDPLNKLDNIQSVMNLAELISKNNTEDNNAVGKNLLYSMDVRSTPEYLKLLYMLTDSYDIDNSIKLTLMSMDIDKTFKQYMDDYWFRQENNYSEKRLSSYVGYNPTSNKIECIAEETLSNFSHTVKSLIHLSEDEISEVIDWFTSKVNAAVEKSLYELRNGAKYTYLKYL